MSTTTSFCRSTCHLGIVAVVALVILAPDSWGGRRKRGRLCHAESPIQQIQKHVVDGYIATGNFSVAYLVVANEIYDGDATIFMGSIAYRYDRSKKKLAIGVEGEPILLVQGNRAWIFLWENGDEPTYLEVTRPQAIGWKDIDESIELVRKECPLMGPGPYLPGPLLPILDGGIEQLFANAQALNMDDKDAKGFFQAAHPDRQPLMPASESKLDPQEFPRCTKTECEKSSSLYAFDRKTGILSCSIEEVPRMQVLGRPGNPVQVFLKQVVAYHETEERSHEFPEVPLRLPTNARKIKRGDLKDVFQEQLTDARLE